MMHNQHRCTGDCRVRNDCDEMWTWEGCPYTNRPRVEEIKPEATVTALQKLEVKE